MSLIRKRHKNSCEMGAEYGFIQLDDNNFVVTKTVGQSVFSYDVQQTSEICGCNINCVDCDICIHAMTCTCVDFCIRFLICKHIHYACQRIQSNSSHQNIQLSAQPLPDEGNLVIDTNQNNKMQEKEALVAMLHKTKSNHPQCSNEAAKACLEFHKVCSEITSTEDDRYIVNELKRLTAYLQSKKASTSHSSLPALPDISQAPPNKSLDQQRNSRFIIKKKRNASAKKRTN